MDKEKVKIGQIYKYDLHDDLYVRITQIGRLIKATYVKNIGKQLSNHGWSLGHTATLGSFSLWHLYDASNCLICNKRNPCKSTQVLCFGCREKKS